MKLACETLYDPIGMRYLKPKDKYVINLPMIPIIDRLNGCIRVNGSITYREYFDVLKEFFDNANAPGCFSEILDWQIPVESFYWKLVKTFKSMERVEGKWQGKEGTEQYDWTLKYFEKAAV